MTRRFPLMSISIAVVSDARRNFTTPLEIAQVATEIKDYVKNLPGSNYLIDRRTSQRSERLKTVLTCSDQCKKRPGAVKAPGLLPGHGCWHAVQRRL